MIIEKKSLLTGEYHTMDIPVTRQQLTKWDCGELIQNVMPHLTLEQREFLISGTTPEEWELYLE